MTRKPEVVAPAGDREALRAAVANGADAVYFGLPQFNARQRAANMPLEELPEVLGYLHDHNVRGYITFNTLLFSEELPRAAEMLKAVAAAGADAVVVQDLGLLRLARELVPTLRVHASTQMTLTEPRAIHAARAMGVARVILPRELSLDDIGRVAQETDAELEVFVHGALCISYSGQCLASEALGGRSANRGLCAQPCRLAYDLIVDGRPADLGERRHLLSPLDLAAYDRIGRLVALGVAGLKIEGRLKSAPYVAIATRVYRDAVDAALNKRPFRLPAEQERALAQSFSRGFTHGFLDGERHPRLVEGRSPRSRGIPVGRVAEVRGGRVIVELERGAGAESIQAGDGLLFDPGRPDRDEQGGRVFKAAPCGAPGRLALTFRESDVMLSALEPGQKVWKTDDPSLSRKLEQTYARDIVPRRTGVDIVVRAALGEPLRVTLADEEQHRVEVTSDRPLECAEKRPVSLDLIREQFSRLGDTPFELRAVRAEKLDPVLAPKSVLNDLRRRGVEALLALRRTAAQHAVAEPQALEQLRQRTAVAGGRPAHDNVQLHVLVRTMEQFRAAAQWARELPEIAGMITCDFREARLLLDAVEAGHRSGARVGAAALRILAPRQERFLRSLCDARPDAVLIRNLGTLGWLKEHAPDIARIGDFSLNIANDLCAAQYAEMGLQRLVPSFDLTWPQLAHMLRFAPPEWFEVVLHQHMPMFHTEHCLFAANLATPDPERCPGHCRSRRIALRDRVGAAHPVLTDAACRNTLFNARPQSACEWVADMKRARLRHFRIDLLNEDAAATDALLRLYSRLLAGTLDGKSAWRQLRDMTGATVTRGTMA